ncbi:MAG: CDP-alcohol phosphatidyltransferase family protein [Flavobacteriales bacterium]|nr:CDP-alcohol phosphatidyltransferase family protein [Flavobacteriales bacterium]
MLSILLASQGQLTAACWLVFAAAVFDVFDGLAARALGGGTPLGAQLDSLADMVSFGVAPGIIAYVIVVDLHLNQFQADLLVTYIQTSRGHLGTLLGLEGDILTKLIRISIPVVIGVASCWRLAKFNLDKRQTSGFLGLPTPANALFWASIGLGLNGQANGLWDDRNDLILRLLVSVLAYPVGALILSMLLGILMLSELPLPSLKFKHFRWSGNQVIYLLGGVGAVLVVLYGILAVPLILLLYLLSPLWGKLFPRAQDS